MALRLILIRHAKSDWSGAERDDAERPLNGRGRAACDAIGPWLAGEGYVPETVLCSSAIRTQETWSRLAAHLAPAPDPTLLPELYLAAPDTLLAALRRATGASVALIGHNPGIGELAGRLCRQAPAHARFGTYPTLATLVLRIDSDRWSDLTHGVGQPVDFIVPRDLTD